VRIRFAIGAAALLVSLGLVIAFPEISHFLPRLLIG